MTVGRVIDISSAQHSGTASITWSKVKAAGVTTAIVKATQGTGYVNPWFERDVQGAQAVGIATLAYHYADWGTVQAEAEHFLATVGTLTLPRMLDAEGDTAHVQWSNTFLGLIAPTPAERLYYGGSSALSQIGSQITARLMVAAYPAHGAPTVGYPGYGVLWQYTDTAAISGIVGPVDESKWYGTDSQYGELFGFTLPTPPLTEEEMMGASIAVAPDGTIHIAAVGKGNARTTHLLYVAATAGGTNPSVIDLTQEIANIPNSGKPFLVSP
jgi:hypothetical protein